LQIVGGRPPLVDTKEEADVAMDVLEECIQVVGK
jgi:hypothetical protein